MPVTTTPGQRFTQLIQQLGLTKNAFAQSLGKTATVIQHIVDERNKPGYDLLNRVCEVYPNVASEWLLRGLGPMLREQNPAPLFAEATPAEPAPVPGGIDPADIPHAPRRRAGNLLQPEDITATLALAGPPLNGNGNGYAAPVTANKEAPVQAPLPPAAASATPAAMVAEAAPAPAVAAATVAPAAAPAASAPAAAPGAPPLPDAAYLAALFQTQQLQHQLVLAEQRNQHLLEQQALLRQMVELLQGR